MLASDPAASGDNVAVTGFSFSVICCEGLGGYLAEAGYGWSCSRSPSQTLAWAWAVWPQCGAWLSQKRQVFSVLVLRVYLPREFIK